MFFHTSFLLLYEVTYVCKKKDTQKYSSTCTQYQKTLSHRYVQT